PHSMSGRLGNKISSVSYIEILKSNFKSNFIIIISVLPLGRFVAPGPWLLPFLQSLLLTMRCMGPRRDTHGVYRPWYSPQLLPIEGIIRRITTYDRIAATIWVTALALK